MIPTRREFQRSLCFCLLIPVHSLLVSGCDQRPKTYAVSGTVTFNGEPLKEGDVYFYSSDSAVGTDAGKIVDGRFHFRSGLGKKRVEIRASRMVPGRTTPMGGPLRLEFIPAEYNDRSALSVEVSPDGGNEYEFKLKGQR